MPEGSYLVPPEQTSSLTVYSLNGIFRAWHRFSRSLTSLRRGGKSLQREELREEGLTDG
jgi:hypothetical protein